MRCTETTMFCGSPFLSERNSGLADLLDSLLDAMGLTDRDAYDILISVAIGRAMDIRFYCPDDPGAYIADVRCRISDLIGVSQDGLSE